ncbi:MAG: helix-turn-helix domain-containing protein [Clostridiales bacterium]|nr:helix-turn-helix domain-containing protein [Clostridiales bacterium]
MRKNESVSTNTLNRLFEILECSLSDIAEFRKDEDS